MMYLCSECGTMFSPRTSADKCDTCLYGVSRATSSISNKWNEFSEKQGWTMDVSKIISIPNPLEIINTLDLAPDPYVIRSIENEPLTKEELVTKYLESCNKL